MQRKSLDSDRGSSSSPAPQSNGIPNGHAKGKEANDGDSELDLVARLQRDLDQAKEEKDKLAAQYNTLLARLTTMRTTLGNKLKQDAVRALTIQTVRLYIDACHPARKN